MMAIIRKPLSQVNLPGTSYVLYWYILIVIYTYSNQYYIQLQKPDTI